MNYKRNLTSARKVWRTKNMKYRISTNYIKNIEIGRMPYTNFYDDGKNLKIIPALYPDKRATMSYKNDVPDINKIRLSKRLRNVYDIQNIINLTYVNGAYETKIKHSLNNYQPMIIRPTLTNIPSDIEKVEDLQIFPELKLNCEEKITGLYKISIFTKQKRFICLEPTNFFTKRSLPYYTASTLGTEYGNELAWYPFDEVVYLCEGKENFKIHAAMLQKLDWNYKTKLSLFRSVQIDGRYVYYIAEETNDWITNQKLNSAIDQITYGYISEKTEQNKGVIELLIQKTQECNNLKKSFSNFQNEVNTYKELNDLEIQNQIDEIQKGMNHEK